MTRRPIACYILHTRCRGCQRGSFAAGDGPLPPCVCGLRRWRVLEVWDLSTEAYPISLQRTRPAVEVSS
jgi:hypothetical protein